VSQSEENLPSAFVDPFENQRRSFDLLTSLQSDVITPQYQFIAQLQADLKGATDRLLQLQSELGKKAEESDSLRSENMSLNQSFFSYREESLREQEKLKGHIQKLEGMVRKMESVTRESQEREGEAGNAHRDLQVSPLFLPSFLSPLLDFCSFFYRHSFDTLWRRLKQWKSDTMTWRSRTEL
jgi:hypothetical protein